MIYTKQLLPNKLTLTSSFHHSTLDDNVLLPVFRVIPCCYCSSSTFGETGGPGDVEDDAAMQRRRVPRRHEIEMIDDGEK